MKKDSMKKMVKRVLWRYRLKYPMRKVVFIGKCRHYLMIETMRRSDYRKGPDHIVRRFESPLYIYDLQTGNLSHVRYHEYIKEVTESRKNVLYKDKREGIV